MILGLQIIAIFFSLIMIYLATLNYKRREIVPAEFYSWIIIWVATIFIVIFPSFLRELSIKFAVTRLFDLMVVLGFILVIIMVSVSYVRTRKLEKKFEELVRREALKKGVKKARK
jgi:hypothetical protein